eukprot:m.252248 g.252248  ORF g.252248 m.252248 type:complete len:542 (-) comp15470_c3_seq1:144-1769(-)
MALVKVACAAVAVLCALSMSLGASGSSVIESQNDTVVFDNCTDVVFKMVDTKVTNLTITNETDGSTTTVPYTTITKTAISTRQVVAKFNELYTRLDEAVTNSTDSFEALRGQLAAQGDALNTAVADNMARITDVNARADTLSSDLASTDADLAAEVAAREGLASSLDRTADQFQVAIDAVNDRVTAAVADATTLSTYVSTLASNTDSTLATLASQIGSLSSLLNQVRAKTEATSTAVAAMDTSSIDKLLACNAQGKIYDKASDACKLPLPLTDAQFTSCTSTYNGLLRFDRSSKNVEVCLDGEFRPVVDNTGLDPATPGESCKHVLSVHPGAPSGKYWIKTGSSTYAVFCDMERDGGGWTLVMKISNSGHNAFFYNSGYWSTTSTVNADSVLADDNVHHINLAYSQLAFTQIRLAAYSQDIAHIHSISKNSARELFTGSAVGVSTSRDAFFAYTNPVASSGNWGNQPYCNVRGFNVHDGYAGRCRYGNIMNNENECRSSDSAIGFGCYTNDQPNGPRAIGAGGFRWSPDTVWSVRGWIYVR